MGDFRSPLTNEDVAILRCSVIRMGGRIMGGGDE